MWIKNRFWQWFVLAVFCTTLAEGLYGAKIGPDTYGYVGYDTATFSWIDATTGTRLVLEGDDNYTSLSIGFTFKFYAVNYTTAYVSTNGLLSFPSGSSTYSNTTLPSVVSPNGFIAPYWDDLYVETSPRGVYYLLQGTAPNRTLTIEWYEERLLGGGSYFTFEVILYEGSNDIKIQYTNMGVTGSGATCGIENETGSVGLQYSYNSAVLTSGKAILFSVCPKIDSVSPDSGYVGTEVTIRGTRYGASQGSNKVYFTGIDAGTANSWSNDTIVINVPVIDSADTLNCAIYVDGVWSNSRGFLLKPKIETITAGYGYINENVVLNGTAYGASQGNSKIYFEGIEAGNASSWSGTSITTVVPALSQAGSFAVSVVVNGQASNIKNITLKPYVAEISPEQGTPGAQVTITGAGYGGSQGNSKATFSDKEATVVSWSGTKITIMLPDKIDGNGGSIGVTVNGLESNKKYFFAKESGNIETYDLNGGEKIFIDGESRITLNVKEKTFKKPVIFEVASVKSNHAKKGKIDRADMAGKNVLKYYDGNSAVEILVWEEDGSRKIGESDFYDSVTMKIYYAGIAPEVEPRLRICRLDEENEKWEIEKGSRVNMAENYVWTELRHFSIYRVMAEAEGVIENVVVYPNPWNKGEAVENAVKFLNVTNNCELQIYDVLGNLVYEKGFENTGGGIRWGLKNGAGADVVAGCYIYLIKSDDGRKAYGKILLIK